MDRGFYSNQNILEMNNPENGIGFIQPFSFTIKKVKGLITENKYAVMFSSL
jgi:hypothetical protein